MIVRNNISLLFLSLLFFTGCKTKDEKKAIDVIAEAKAGHINCCSPYGLTGNEPPTNHHL